MGTRPTRVWNPLLHPHAFAMTHTMGSARYVVFHMRRAIIAIIEVTTLCVFTTRPSAANGCCGTN